MVVSQVNIPLKYLFLKQRKYKKGLCLKVASQWSNREFVSKVNQLFGHAQFPRPWGDRQIKALRPEGRKDGLRIKKYI